jgi:hypothetical protein
VIDCVHLSRTPTRGQRCKNSGTRTQIDDTIAGLNMATDRGVIEIHSRLVSQHPFLLKKTGEVTAVEFPVSSVCGVLGSRKKPSCELRSHLDPRA